MPDIVLVYITPPTIYLVLCIEDLKTFLMHQKLTHVYTFPLLFDSQMHYPHIINLIPDIRVLLKALLT